MVTREYEVVIKMDHMNGEKRSIYLPGAYPVDKHGRSTEPMPNEDFDLGALFYNTYYDIETGEDVTDEIVGWDVYTDDTFDAGYQAGYDKCYKIVEFGWEEGYDAGHDAGFNMGRDEPIDIIMELYEMYLAGNDDGYKDGWDTGYLNGVADIDEATKETYEYGRDDGWTEGYAACEKVNKNG